MKVCIIGTGYVGLVTGTCLADMGNDVTCVDINKKIIDNLKKGVIHIFEPGLSELVKRNAKEKRLSFTTDYNTAVKDSEIIFIAVGTPQKDDGSADLSYIFSAAKGIAEHMDSYKVIVVKSTVPVGTSEKVREVIKENLKRKIEFDVADNPETLREGEAIKDFTNPDRVILGTDSEKAKTIMHELYKGLERADKPIIFTDIHSAELIKYVSNAMLAIRISFMNQIAPLCEKVGADIKAVAKGVGLDSRIGPRFLQAGAGYGGSCFPKDIRALAYNLKQHGLGSEILDATDQVNEKTKKSIIHKVKKLVPDLKDKKIAIWGLAFKPKTDDMREAPSITLIKQLQSEGAKVRVFDPEAITTSKKYLENIEYAENPYHALEGCDAVVLITEWDEFRNLDKQKMKQLLNKPNFIDARNVYDPKEMKSLGFNYLGVGR
ncbi:MAG: UDP-glucose/GDP-mannose dehydrogenase family protein [Nanoarchaeota archaeon]|nr:UDP-glucose/GDP-mannose dehydrogenase family protein [Nanoarchaeota archaeon]